jgi:ubiquinone/menaquinone biosynthesis C-methylase UbiE
MSDLVPTTNFSESWAQVDNTEDPTFYVNMLDATRAHLLERARRSPTEFYKPLELESGQRVLDAGCGTGDFLRLLAPLIAPGAAVGIDLSQTMIEEAQRRSDSGNPNVSFQTADVLNLPFEDGSFDRAIADRLLLHVPDLERALEELCRVLAPDGRLSVSEYDWDSMLVECSDRALGRRFTRLVCDQMYNGLIVRELPRQLRALGFNAIEIIPEVRVSQDLDAFCTWLIEPSMRHFARIGAFSREETEYFLEDLNERARTGRYFFSRTFYTIVARCSR